MTENARLRWCRSSQEEPPHVLGQRRLLIEATPRQRSGVVVERSKPTTKEWWLLRHRRAERSYTTFKVRRGDLSKVRSSGCTLLEQP